MLALSSVYQQRILALQVVSFIIKRVSGSIIIIIIVHCFIFVFCALIRVSMESMKE